MAIQNMTPNDYSIFRAAYAQNLWLSIKQAYECAYSCPDCCNMCPTWQHELCDIFQNWTREYIRECRPHLPTFVTFCRNATHKQLACNKYQSQTVDHGEQLFWIHLSEARLWNCPAKCWNCTMHSFCTDKEISDLNTTKGRSLSYGNGSSCQGDMSL